MSDNNYSKELWEHLFVVVSVTNRFARSGWIQTTNITLVFQITAEFYGYLKVSGSTSCYLENKTVSGEQCFQLEKVHKNRQLTNLNDKTVLNPSHKSFAGGLYIILLMRHTRDQIVRRVLLCFAEIVTFQCSLCEANKTKQI